MARKRSTTLWEGGVPLGKAWLELASASDRDAHMALPGWEIVGTTTFAPDAPFVERALSMLSVVGKSHSEKIASEGVMKQELLGRIRAGEFELLGYRVAPTGGREPVVIPSPILEKYEPDWRDETIEFRDERYLDLRVATAELRRTGAKRGRPGSTDVILAAIDELSAPPRSDFCSIARPQAAQRVRELLQSRGIEVDQAGNGLSDQNVAKLILKRCPKRRIK